MVNDEPKLEIRNSKIGQNRPTKAGAVKDFKDLMAWKLARELRRAIYEATKRMPAEEKYVLIAQMRRAAISVTANLAEGFGRFSYQENLQFCRHARGSAMEERDHLTTALDAGYITKDDWKTRDDLAQRVIQVVNGYIRSTRSRQKTSES